MKVGGNGIVKKGASDKEKVCGCEMCDQSAGLASRGRGRAGSVTADDGLHAPSALQHRASRHGTESNARRTGHSGVLSRVDNIERE